jgi:predicted Zn-dependent protease
VNLNKKYNYYFYRAIVMKTRRIFLRIFITGCFMISTACTEVDQTLQKSSDALAPHDIVTGARELNPESEEAEIKRASEQSAQVIAQEGSKGHATDVDGAMLSHLQGIMDRLVKVSHRPQLPWDIHLVESPTVNAFTVGGGKIFFYRGLFGGLIDENNDNEIAAVMAHEMGHVAARHIGKRQGDALASMISSGAKKSTVTQYIPVVLQ